MIFITKGATTSIGIIKDNGDSSFGNTSLSLLIHELLKIRSPNLLQIGDAKNKANGIEYVTLAGTVQSGDGVEEGVETWNDRSCSVGFETFQAYLLYVHR